jgi:2-oxoisovalerate dehydrogenase E1 component
LHQLPILYLIQDNEWDISATAKETRAMSATEYARGFKGLETRQVNGSDFIESYTTIQAIFETIRKERRPFLLHAKVPLLNHHTSGVRKEWYRPAEDLLAHAARDPIPYLRAELVKIGLSEESLFGIEQNAKDQVEADYQKALIAPEPDPSDLYRNIFVPTPVTQETGIRVPIEGKEIVMVDAALHAIDRIMSEHPEALVYGQDVGGELGGVFREAALLAKKYGDKRVFNTPIQEAYIIGSTVGMSAVGLKPFVEVQFADYVWPGLNQLFAEVSRSCYLSDGKWPVGAVIRVPIGAYGSGGPYHSSSVESAILTIKGIKVAYPSNAADMKGLMRSAFFDPNPVVMFEHKGLYWGKVPGSREARCIEPDDYYIVPFGKARVYLEASTEAVENGESCLVVTYGMGVHWAKNASVSFPGRVEILDLRSLEPYDWEAIQAGVRKHGKVLVLTEEQTRNSFAESLAGRISFECFRNLDGPVYILGAENIPAVPLNSILEHAMLPSTEKVSKILSDLLNG